MGEFQDLNLLDSKILIVDDTPANIDVLRGILRAEGYRIFVAKDGPTAIKVATRVLPDLILLDVMMPDMDGFETYKELKRVLQLPRDIPIIFVTARSDIEDIVNGFRIGAIDYIRKPINREEVCARVKTHLSVQSLIRSQDIIIGALSDTLKEKTDRMADMSHELRSPITAILGYGARIKKLATDAELPGNVIESSDRILCAGDYLLRLINNLLDLAKIDAGKTNLNIVHFKMGDLVMPIENTAAPLMEVNKNKLSICCDDTEAEVLSDFTKLQQILLNLVANAAKFTKGGHVELRMSVAKDHINFSVKDDGIGMSREQIEKVFKPFVQGGKNTAEEYGGTGLGLSISKKLISMLGGKISVTSAIGQGTEFSFYVLRNKVIDEGHRRIAV